MSQGTRSTLIAAVVASIVTALITAGATVWAIQSGKRAEIEEEKKEAIQELASNLAAAADQIAKASGAAAAHDPIFVKTLTATFSSEGSPGSSEDGPVKADLCLLTSVGSYGGARKGCTLTQGSNGWTLAASARNATSACQATCFNFRPNPGPPTT